MAGFSDTFVLGNVDDFWAHWKSDEDKDLARHFMEGPHFDYIVLWDGKLFPARDVEMRHMSMFRKAYQQRKDANMVWECD